MVKIPFFFHKKMTKIPHYKNKADGGNTISICSSTIVCVQLKYF